MPEERHVSRPANHRLRTQRGLRVTSFAVAVAALLLVSPVAHAATGDNLALGKPVTMSGGDSADPTQQGSNCTDGITGGNYPTNTICRTLGLQTGTNREWVEVDLGQDYVIDRVRLSNRTDGTNGDFARWIIVTTRPSAMTGVTSNPQSTLDQTLNPDAPFVNKLAYAAGTGVGTSYGTAQAAAWTTLDLKIGAHIARYVRIYSMKPAPTALNLAEIQVFEGPPPVRTITNGSLDLPAIAAGTYHQVAQTLVPGWSTTEPVALPDAGFGTAFVDGGVIEKWGTGFQGVTADNGSVFVELNAFTSAALSPTPLCVYPGETFQWRVSHRARGSASQVDVARLRIDGQNIASFSDGTTQAGTHTCAATPGFTCTPQTGSPTATGWGRWQGNWTNPLAQPVTMTLEFAAISSSSPALGNFMDNVSISGLTAAVELGGNTAGPETTPSANLPLLLVNGSVTAAQTIQLDITGGSATRGVDYTTMPATGPITVTIPVGTYDGTPATAVSLAPYVQVSTDYIIEGDETIDFSISNASAGLSIAGASGCRSGVVASTYTINDTLLPRLNVTKTASPAMFGTGHPASYSITVLNDGDAPTSGNITLSDTLPAGIALASAVGTNWSCTGTTTLACTFTGTLAVNGSTTLTLNVNVSVGSVAAGGNNSATARGGGDPGCPAAGITETRCTGSVSVAVTSGYVCSPSTIFVAQSATTQLDAATFTAGSLVFTPTGPPSPWTYNAIGYRADDFIYGITQNRDASHPQNHLLLVDPGTGAVADLGAVTGGLTPAGGVNVGAFDGSGNYFVANGSENHFFRINLATRVATSINVSPLQALGLADFTFANGFLWGVDGSANPATMARLDPVTGAITRFNLPAAVIPTGTGFGAAWTFGNGNLGFSDNATGNVYQIRVTNPTGTPTFARVGLSSGPSSTSNDGTSCVSPPVDLAITKTGPANFVPGGAISWTLTVTNKGPLTSSGYTVTDTVPAGVTGVSSPTPGCSVAGNVVTCVAGTLANGASATFTINGIAPPAPTAVTHVVPFSFTGADQSFTVPPGVGSISVKLWGAGAGGSNSAGFYSTGGAGGYVSGDISVVPGTVYSIVAGEGGWSDGNTNWNTRPYGFGGKAQSQSFGSDGGGLSGIFAGGTPVLTTDSARAVVVAGGGGGGEMGTSFGVSVGGQGGDPAQGGGMGTMTGGDNTTSPAGGGGGGGGYAGGVTNRPRLRYPAAATVTMGEGGASFIAAGVMNGSSLFSPDHVSPFTTVGNSIPPNTGDAQYVAGIGVGTYVTFAKGGDGRVVIQYVTPPVPLTPLVNVATVEGNESDPIPGNNTGTQNVNPPAPAMVTLVKTLFAENGTIAGKAEPGEQLTYKITLTNSGGAAATGYGVTDTLDPNVGFVSADNGGTFAAGDVTWTGLAIPANNSVTLTLVVQVSAPIPAGVARIANSARPAGQPAPNCSVTPLPGNCTALPTVAQFKIAKVAGAPAPTGVPNEYRISYVATVTNAGGSAGNYDLSDTLTFNGATVTAISAPVYSTTTGDTQSGTLGAFAPATGGTIVSNEALAPLGVERWSYTVTYLITNAALAANCSAPGGGLRNSAALGGGVTGVPPAPTCSGAPNVSIVKLAATPVPTGNPNQFTLTYTVDVANNGTLAGSYNLSDTLSFNGATVNAISAPVYSSTTGDTRTGTLGTLTPPAGGTIVTNESIAASGAERWVYTVTYTVTNAAAAQDCSVANGGLRNAAALGGSLNGTSNSCTGAPAVVIGKSVSGPLPTGNLNEYRLTYLVRARNDGSLAGSYSLSDTFTFPGVSGVAVSAVTHGGPDPQSSATLGPLTAAGGVITPLETIAAGSSETFSYDVVFTVSNIAAIGSCNASGGLTNRAALGGSSSGFVSTCSDVPNIAVVKTPGAPAGTGAPNQYVITYNVVVTNSGRAAGVYNLSDAFTFAGATINAVGAVIHAGSDPLSTSLGTLTTSGGTIVNAEPIAANGSESYSYSVTFTLSNPALANNCASPGGGLRNTAALGGSVAGSNSACSGAPIVAITKALTSENGTQAGVAEPGETLTYTLTLTNSGSVAATAYSVSDQLDPNTSFLSSTGGGVYTGGVVTWSGLAVPAGGSTSVTITVIVNAPIAGGVTQLGNRAYQTGTTPPACPPASPQCVVTPTASTVLVSKALTSENGAQAGIAEPGEQLTYTLTLNNVGGSAATGFAVTDQLDPNTTFVSASNGGTFSAGAVNWTGLTVPASGNLQLTVVVSVNIPVPAGVTRVANVAFATGSIPPACPPASPQCAVMPTAAQVSLVKTLTGESGSQPGVAEPGEQLTYTITLTNSGGSTATNYGASDRLDPLTSLVSASNGGVLVSGDVRWSGLTIAAGSSLVLTAVVQVANPIPAGTTSISNVAFKTGTTPPPCPPAGSQCVTTPTAAQLKITKSGASPVPTGTPNQFFITYTATASNTGGSTATYTLTDALTFNGATINAISTPLYATSTGDTQTGTVGPFGLPNGGTIVTNETLAPLGVETWTYTVTYTVTNASLAAACSNPAGGLRNSAAISGGGTAATCSGAANVDVLKTASTPVPTGNPNQFTIDYQVQVRNTGTLTGVYSLTDTLSFNGATVTAITAPAFSSATGDVRDGTLGTFNPPSGGTIISGESISVGGAETWRYTVTYTITNAGLAQNCASPSGGLRNRAELGGSFNGESANCTGAPAVVIGKSASGPLPTGNPNEYSILYLVTVQNNGSLSGTYNLSDTFTLPGTSGVSAGAISHGGTDPLATPLGTLTSSGGTIVTGETIAAGASENFTYRLTFTVAGASTIGRCSNAGGLRNLAALGGSSSGQVNTCSDVPDISVVKSAATPFPAGPPNQFSIAYTVDVVNNGAAAGVYDLADTFAFAGATINAVTAVSHSGNDPLSTTLGTLTAAGGTIVDDEPIDPGRAERYAYSVTYTVTNPALAADCVALANGLRNAATLGGSAAGSASTCSGAANVALLKTASVPVPAGSPNQFTLTYTVTVQNLGSIAGSYNLSDALTFNGATVSSVTAPAFSSPSGDPRTGALGTFTGPAGGTIVTGEPITAGGTEIWTYSVTYTVTNAASAQNCTSPTGGLRNRASLGGSFNGQSANCTGAPAVVIGKSASGPTPTGTLNEYTIDYVVGVQNDGTLSGTYNLSDAFTLPGVTGVTVSAVVHGGSDPLTTALGTLTSSGGTIVSGESIAAGASETYAYSIRFTVANAATVGTCAAGGGLRNLASLGGSSSGQVSTCSGVPNVGIVKSLAAESGTQSGFAEPGETLTYNITLTNFGGSAATNYAVSDRLDPLTSFVSASNGGVLLSGDVRWSGLTIPAGSSLLLSAVVQVANPIPAGATAISNVAYRTGTTPPPCPPAGSQCVITPTAGQIRITKNGASPVATGTPNQFRITYVATATNSGGSTANYTLTDTLTFNGATINAISTPVYATSTGDTQSGTRGVFSPPNGGTIVSGEGLNSLGVETWTYTVTYTVTNAALAAACSNPGGGLRNSAGIGGGAATTCSGAANVDMLKTASAPVPTGTPNQFSIDYRVQVRNTGTLAGSYALSDTLTFNGANVTAITQPAFSSATGDVQDGTRGTFAAPGGGNIVSGETIGVSGEETWRYTVTYTITNAVLAQNCASPSGGLRNRAELGGSFNGESGICTGAPAVVIGKSANGPIPTGNPNEYAIDYLVTVQNNGSLSGTYNLSDTFTLPGTSGATVGAVSHGGADPLATSLGTLSPAGGTIVTGETIAAGASENFTYRLTFLISDSLALGRCSGNGGLRNLAALGGSSSGQVDTCSDVPDIAIVKSAGTPFPTGAANQFSIAYTVDVLNNGSAAGAYDLSDSFAFAGATINAVSSVTHSGSDPLSTTMGTLSTAGGTIVHDEPIAPGRSERYAYSVTYTLTNPALAADCVSPAAGLRNRASLGGSATGAVSTCAGAADVVLFKTAAAPVPTGSPNQFTLTYTVNVRNLGSIAGSYGLSDALTFNGANVNSVTAPAFSSPTGDPRTGVLGTFAAPAGGTIVSAETIAAGGTEVWTYTVTYTVTNPSTAQNCSSPSGGLRNRASLGGSFNGLSTVCTGAPAVVIGKSASGPTPTATPNVFTIDYLVEVQNDGTLPGSYILNDVFTLPGVTGVTVSAVTHGGSDPLATTLGTLTAGGGTIVTGESIAAGARETYAYSVRFTVADAATTGSCAGGGGLRNLAFLGGSSSGQVSTCGSIPNVAIVKTLTSESGAQPGVAEPGETLTYAITLTNSGSVAATGYSVSDPLDANVTFVSASNGGVLNAGVVTWSGLTIAPAASLTLTIAVRVASALPPVVTRITNVAYQTGTVPPNCTTLPMPQGCVVLPAGASPRLSITKTVDRTTSVPGGTLIYTVTVNNVGTVAVSNAQVNDPIPAGIAAFAWTCAASGGALCPNPSGSGALAETIPTFPPGGTLAYTITATVGQNPPEHIANIANITPPGIAVCAPGGTPAPCFAAVGIPAISSWMLLLMGIALLAIAWQAGQRPG